MQKDLSAMTMGELATMAMPVIQNFQCSCCGSRDLSHDVEACKQAAYVGFDIWRAGLMDAGVWDSDECVDQDWDSLPADTGEVAARAGICPAMGLY